jgi:hypothetical protein
MYVVGDEQTLNSNLDVTFPIFSSLENVKPITYQELIKSKNIIASEVPLFICFPFELWDKVVETKDVLYGSRDFGESIKVLDSMINDYIYSRFPNALYVNQPSSILVERDKQTSKDILNKKGLRTAEDIEKSINAVIEEVERGNSVYIKVRYGSMGKGITYLSPNKWTTNFNYSNGKIQNHKNDYDWKEIDVTGDKYLLEQVLAEDVVVEKAVSNSLTNGFKFDLRGRALFGEVFERFMYGRATYDSSITNVSQGAKRIDLSFIEQHVPKDKIYEAQQLISESAMALGLNYAGVDILFEGENFDPVFLEANSFPGPHMAEKLLPVLHRKILSKFNREKNLAHEMYYHQSQYTI